MTTRRDFLKFLACTAMAPLVPALASPAFEPVLDELIKAGPFSGTITFYDGVMPANVEAITTHRVLARVAVDSVGGGTGDIVATGTANWVRFSAHGKDLFDQIVSDVRLNTRCFVEGGTLCFISPVVLSKEDNQMAEGLPQATRQI